MNAESSLIRNVILSLDLEGLLEAMQAVQERLNELENGVGLEVQPAEVS